MTKNEDQQADRIEELVRAYWESWQEPADFDAMEAHLAEDVRFDAGMGAIVGAANVRAMVEQNPEPWNDVTLVDSAFWADGASIVYEGVGSTTQVRHRIAELLRVDGDRITSVTATFAQVPQAS